MVMELEAYQIHLQHLNDPELSHSDRVEHVLAIQSDYTSVITEHQQAQETIAKLQKDKDDLLLANSKYYRELQSQEQNARDALVPEQVEPIKLSDIFD